MGGRKEMQTDHILGPFGRGGDFIHIEIGGIGGKDRAGFADRIQLGEKCRLGCHILKDRLDHQIGPARGIQIVGTVQRSESGIMRLFAQLAAFQRASEIALNPGTRLRDSFALRFNKVDVVTADEQGRGNANPHRPAADHGDVVYLPGLRGLLRDIDGGALGKERMHQRGTFLSRHQFHKQRPFSGEPFVNRQGGGADRLQRCERCLQGRTLSL